MKIVINPKYEFLKDFITGLPERFPEEGVIIYNERNVLKSYQVQGVNLVVKSFRVPIFINRIAYSFFRKSKASRSYEYGMGILERGSSTPEPIAYIEEYKCGLLNRSYYCCINEADAMTVRSFMDGSNLQADDLLRSFVRFTAGLHQAGILHIDYSPGNILVKKTADGEYAFTVIDINRLRFQEVSTENALRNFDRLALSPEVSTRLAGMYAECCSLDREETIRKINEYSDRFFFKRTMKEAIKSVKRKKGKFRSLFGPVQFYLLLLRIRLLLCGGSHGILYRKERELYLNYIYPVDERKVLDRKFHYSLS